MSNYSWSPTDPGMGPLEQDDPEKKSPKKTTKKLVDRQIIIAGIFAVIVAIAGFVWFQSLKADAYVVTAKTGLAAGTQVTTEMVEATPIKSEYLTEGAISAPTAEEAVTAAQGVLQTNPRLKYPVGAKQQLTTDMFGADIVLDKPLEPTERLMSISATVLNAVAGEIQPGDRVDLYAAAKEAGITGLLQADVPIVSVTLSEEAFKQWQQQQAAGDDTNTDTKTPAKPIPGMYLIRVPTDVAARAATVQTQGGEFVMLYRGADAAAPAPGVQTILDAICGGPCETVKNG